INYEVWVRISVCSIIWRSMNVCTSIKDYSIHKYSSEMSAAKGGGGGGAVDVPLPSWEDEDIGDVAVIDNGSGFIK
ncbi:MAG: hypothetical protein VX017_11240, partial [Pseudomonadota bacterium]|nr:hypothetical protein [Pseudomonadota bacterium]